MSDIPKILKRFIVPVAFVTISSYLPVVNANTVRIVGPSNEDGSYSQANRNGNALPSLQTIPQSSTTKLTARRYGPTGEKETLWSIASRHRPNASVSVYQVIGAIYHVNPQAFENSNIHGLVPGSYLVMPTLSQINNEKESLIRRQLEADKKRAPYLKTTPKPKRVVKLKPKPEELKTIQAEKKAKEQAATQKIKPADTVVKPVAPTPANTAQPTSEASAKTIEKAVAAVTTAAAVSTATSSTATSAEKPAETVASDVKTADSAEVIPAKPELSEQQQALTDEQMTKLVESNHLLRLRLAEMQQEVEALKDQVKDSDDVRQELLTFLEQQKQLQNAPQPVTPPTSTWFDSLANNPWALAAAGIIPGGLIAALLAFFLLRRKNEDEQDEVKSLQAPDATATDNAPVVVPPMDGKEADSEDADDLDDLFADDDLFNDPDFTLEIDEKDEQSDKTEEKVSDPIAELTDEAAVETSSQTDKATDDIEFDDVFENNVSSSISVKGDDAIGLEDMERALDEMDNEESEPSADEALALMWEKSLNDAAKDDDTADISNDEFDLSHEDFDLSEADNADDKTQLHSEDEELENGLLDQSLLDEILQQAEAHNQDQSADTQEDKADSNAEDVSNAPSENVAQDELDALFNNFSTDLPEFEKTDEAVAEDNLDDETIFEEGSTALLDELVEDDELSSDIELEEDSTALLDELLLDDDEKAQAEEDFEVAEDSTDLLDELLHDDEEIDSFSDNNVALDESSTELLDEILSSQQEASTKESQPLVENIETGQDETVSELDDVIENTHDASDEKQEDALTKAEAPQQDTEDSQSSESLLIAQAENEAELDALFENAFADESAESVASQGGNEPNNSEELQQLSAASEQKFDEILDDVLDEAFYRQSLDSDVKPLTVSDLERELDEQDALANHLATDSGESDEAISVEDLPVFDEEEALKAFDGETYQQPKEDAAHNDVLSLDDLPEFDEQAAFDDPEAEPLDETTFNNDVDEQIALDNVIRQLQQAAEAAEQYKPKADFASNVDITTDHTELENTSAQLGSDKALSPFDTAQHDSYPFEKLDPSSIPEFDESEALQASLDEQHELEQYEIEQGLRLPNEEVAYREEKPVVLDQLDQNMVDSAGLDMDALLFDESLSTEQQPDLPTSKDTEQSQQAEQLTEQTVTPEFASAVNQEASPQITQKVERSGLGLEDDERDGLLTQDIADDINTQAFADELSDDDAKVWQTSASEPELEQEDWTQQPQLVKEDLETLSLESEFSLRDSDVSQSASSELLGDSEKAVEKPTYISIEELMKDDPLHEQADPDANPLNLEVGLDDYPEMLASIAEYDVDTAGEYASKLDLAKAYLEMNDSEGAVGLLEDIAKNAEKALQDEAKKLLSSI
ncbi:FimV/HubP family polar landmark protein [Photobacterium leiognathi]|uniref:FimV/HubP family polar landmark protein n=1 Tax=Photobacterium leiognathi TaxID=553611 RepID=UPI0029812BEA|nr:FimV/HubP family polar landmark protein [Photobacterium leiognathi]